MSCHSCVCDPQTHLSESDPGSGCPQVTRWDARTCRSIAQGGHLHVLQWARQQEPRPGWDELTCAWAAEGGHLHVLQWVRSQDPPCAWWGHANIAQTLKPLP